jgi:hypothetical protein
MDIFLFRSQSHSAVSAFSPDSHGANLPAEYAPWEISERSISVGSDGVAQAIERNGFFLLSGSSHRR